jgi:hypothetical protein
LDLRGLDPRLGAFEAQREAAVAWQRRIGFAQIRNAQS